MGAARLPPVRRPAWADGTAAWLVRVAAIGETASRMSDTAVSVDSLWKSYRLYHERNQYLKAAILRAGGPATRSSGRSRTSRSRCRPGRRSASSARTDRARARCSSASPASSIPEKGSVTVDGRISALLELGAGFHPELSGRENVFLNGAILGLSKKEIAARFDDIVEFAGLEEFIDTPVKNYSSGMFVRLGFAVAANVEPEVLLDRRGALGRRRELPAPVRGEDRGVPPRRSHDRLRQPRPRPGRAALRGRGLDRQGRAAR